MFILLNNASPGMNGLDVAIRTDIIISVYEAEVCRDVENTPDVKEMVTFVYAGSHATWEVKESVPEVIRLINVTMGLVSK